MKKKSEKQESALVVVAHPDDETIWMGGFILEHPEIDWTIFSVCRASDPDRAPKFLKAAKYFGAKGVIKDLEDEGKFGIKQSVVLVESLLKKYFSKDKFDYLFTHGANGEYGHERHIAVIKAVKKALTNKIIVAKLAYGFNYKKADRKKYGKLEPGKNSDLLLKLKPKTFTQKKKIMTKIYGFNPRGIDVGYCTNPESFKKIKY